MGTVIGRQGLKIKHIQDTSGVRMVASKEMLPSSTERIVEVQGTVQGIEVAVEEIGRCLVEDWERGQGTILYHPGLEVAGPGVLAAGGEGGLQPQGGRRISTAPGAPMALTPNQSHRKSNVNGSGPGSSPSAAVASAAAAAASAASAASAAGVPSAAAVNPGGGLAGNGASSPAQVVDGETRIQNISIPSDMVGCIIGVSATLPALSLSLSSPFAFLSLISLARWCCRCPQQKGGSKITEIRRLSGSRISIAKAPHDETGERMFTIQGTAESNEKALFLLYNSLEGEKERRASAAAAAAAAQEKGEQAAPAEATEA